MTLNISGKICKSNKPGDLRNGVSQIKKPDKYRDAIFEIPVVVARKPYFQTVCLTG